MMQDMVVWQAFRNDAGKVDPDKGSVLTVFDRNGENSEVHTFTRKETATLLGAVGLSVAYLDQARERDAAKAFTGGQKGGHV